MGPLDRPALTAAKQIARMAEAYPSFVVLQSTPWVVLWHGALTPLARMYAIQILYSAVSLPMAGIAARTPHVEVLRPLLCRRDSTRAGAIPHIFLNHVWRDRPRLCLHRGWEWGPEQYIADTIVPWTVEWLVAYEGWRATGRWYAGGHGTERAA
jgi:hypothetical protein